MSRERRQSKKQKGGSFCFRCLGRFTLENEERIALSFPSSAPINLYALVVFRISLPGFGSAFYFAVDMQVSLVGSEITEIKRYNAFGNKNAVKVLAVVKCRMNGGGIGGKNQFVNRGI